MEDKAKESFQAIWRKKHKKEDHPDRRNVDACAVPLMIVANKWDSIKDENNPLARDRLGLKALCQVCLLYTSPSPRDGLLSRMPSSA